MLGPNRMITSEANTSYMTRKQPTVPTARTLLIPDCGICQCRHKLETWIFTPTSLGHNNSPCCVLQSQTT